MTCQGPTALKQAHSLLQYYKNSPLCGLSTTGPAPTPLLHHYLHFCAHNGPLTPKAGPTPMLIHILTPLLSVKWTGHAPLPRDFFFFLICVWWEQCSSQATEGHFARSSYAWCLRTRDARPWRVGLPLDSIAGKSQLLNIQSESWESQLLPLFRPQLLLSLNWDE